MFAFTSIELPDGTTRSVNGVVHGVEAPQMEALVVTREGELKATMSKLKQLRALIPLIGPSRHVADPSLDKTVWTRQGDGQKGFGLFGAGAAQSSAGAAIGLAYFGAAKAILAAFLAKGENVVLPANTPLLVRLQD